MNLDRVWSGLMGTAEGLFLVGVVLLPMMRFGTFEILGAVVIPSDLCFGLAAVILLVAELGRGGRDVRGLFPALVVVYLGGLLLATAASSDRRQGLERNVIDGYCVLLGIMSFALSQTAARRTRFAWAWLAGTIVTVGTALIGIALFYLGERSPADNFAVGDLGSVRTSDVPRVVGYFLNANMFCNYLIVGLLFALALVGWRRPAGILLLVAMGITLGFTLSPGLGGAILASALWLVASHRDRWPSVVCHAMTAAGIAGGTLFLVLAIAIGPRPHTWADALETFAHHPLLGVGPGLPVAATFYNGRFFTDAHSVWLNVAGQAGMIGVAGLIAVVAWICVQAWRARPASDLAEPVRAGWFAFVGVVLYGGLSLSLEQTRQVWVVMGFVAAGLAAAVRDRTSARAG